MHIKMLINICSGAERTGAHVYVDVSSYLAHVHDQHARCGYGDGAPCAHKYTWTIMGAQVFAVRAREAIAHAIETWRR